MKKIKVKKVDTFRDGGTAVYTDKNSIRYYVDHRIDTKTDGIVFDRYPDDLEAQQLKVKLEIVKDF